MKQENIKFWVLIATIILSTIVGIMMAKAEVETLGLFKQDDCISLKQSCSNCTYTNLTSIQFPNGTTLTIGKYMTKKGLEYNHTFCNTSSLGKYIVNGYSDVDGANVVWAYDFEITQNGKENPSGVVVIVFIVFFLICLGFASYMIIYNIGHFFSLDFDIIDVAFNWGIYFCIIALYGLSKFYLGNSDIENWLSWCITIGGFVLMFMPILAFILSITIGSLKKKSPYGMRPPRKIWRIR